MQSGKRRGFTYLSLIILVAIIGLVSAASIKLGAVLQRSAAERELLAIGAEYADALESYAKATPPGQSPLPPSFKELLRDPRFPGVRRHLRRIYVDPMTGSSEWGIVYANNAQGQQGLAATSPAQAEQPGMPVPGSSTSASASPLATPSALSAALNPQGGAGTGNGPGAAAGASSPQPLKPGGTAGMVAIYSLSTAKPVKIGNFPVRFQGFENRARISDWKFARATAPAVPQPAPQPQQPGQPGQPGQLLPQPGQAPGQPPQEPPAEPAPPPLLEVPQEPPPEAEPPQRGEEPGPPDGQGEAPPVPANPAKTAS